MYPLLTIQKGDVHLGELYLDRERPKLTVGSSSYCHVTTFAQKEIQNIEAFKFSRNRLILNLVSGMGLRVVVGKLELDLDTLVALGMADQKGKVTRVVLKCHPNTSGGIVVGGLTISFRFQEKPLDGKAITIPRSRYFKSALQGLDKSFIVICVVLVFTSIGFGRYLYGLPTPEYNVDTVRTKTYRFAKIKVDKRDLRQPPKQRRKPEKSKAVASKGKGEKTPRKQPGIQARLGSLLQKIDKKMNIDTRGTSSSNAARGAKATARETTKGSSRSLGKGLDIGRTFDYEIRSRSLQKRVASIGDRGSTLDDGNRLAKQLSSKNAALVMQRASGKLRSCYEEVLKVDRSLEGKIYLNFLIQPTGKPTKINIEATPSLNNEVFLDCIKNIVAKLDFKPTGGKTVEVRHPMIFAPSNVGS